MMTLTTLITLGTMIGALQTAPSTDAKQIVQAASKACKELRTVQFTSESTYGGLKIKASVTQKNDPVPDSGFADGKYRMRGTCDNGKGVLEFFDLAYDGTTLVIKDDDHTYKLEKPTPGETGRYIPMPAIFSSIRLAGNSMDRVFGSDSKLRLLSSKRVGAWTCDVVEVTRTIQNPSLGPVTLTSRWAFDRSSHLPVQYASDKSTTTIVSMKLNPPVDEKVFRVDAPAVAGNEFGPATEDLIPVGQQAPDFRLKDPQGHLHALHEYRGKVLVLDFWATWCIPCRQMMPILESLNKKYRGKQVAILGIAVDPVFDAAAFMRRMGHGYPILVKGDSAGKALRVKMLPTVYVLDPSGRVIHRQAGITREDSTRIPSLVAGLLKGRATSLR